MTRYDQFERFIDSLGLRYFKGSEFTPYWDKVRNGVKNTIPPDSLWPNIVPTIIILDEIRHILKVPVTLTSTYRSPAYNHAIGGEPNSFHMRFMAIDWTCSQDMLYCSQVAKSLRGKLFKLPGNSGEHIFRGGIGIYYTFIHVDCRDREANWRG